MIGEIKYLTKATDNWPPGTTPKVKSDFSALVLGLMALVGDSPLPPSLRPQAPKPLRKCALPGCINNSTRDYCCAEHCAEHRKMDRERRK